MLRAGRHNYDWSGFSSLGPGNPGWDDYSGRFRYLMRYWPVVGSFVQGYDSMKDWDSYLRAHDMSWSDIKHWSKMGGSGFSGTYQMVSKNILSLYK